MIVKYETPQQLIDLNFPAANSNSPPLLVEHLLLLLFFMDLVEHLLTHAKVLNAFIKQ